MVRAVKNPRVQKILIMLEMLPEADKEELLEAFYPDLQKAKRQREECDRLLKEIEELKKLLKTASSSRRNQSPPCKRL